MGFTRENAVVTVHGDSTDHALRAAIALLDRSGLSYRQARISAGSGGGAAQACLSCGTQYLTDLSRDRVVDFLWEHGARFEDS
jgi:hypothetical protein